MGGSLIALALIYQLATAKPVLQPWGVGLLAATLLTASFLAWSEEREKNDKVEAERPTMNITYVAAYGGEEQRVFTLHVRLLNPGPRPTSFAPDWDLNVTKANGERVHVRGTMMGVVRPMQQGDQFDVRVFFPYGPKLEDYSALVDARYELGVVDIHGFALRAVYPTGSSNGQ